MGARPCAFYGALTLIAQPLRRPGEPIVSVIFQCPIAGGEVRTDIKADRAMLAKNRNIRLYVRCECCGAEHRFSAKEGALEAA